MRAFWIPATAVVLLSFCTPGVEERREGGAGDGRGRETGMGEGGMAGEDSAPSANPAAGGQTGAASQTSDAAILSALSLDNQREVQSAQFAAKQARNPQVRQFAQTLERDHRMALQEGQKVAKQIGATPEPPARESAATEASNPDLEGKTGAEFDRAFVDYQIKHHEEEIEKLRSELLPTAQNPQVKALIQKSLPKMEQHLATARKIEQQLQS